jgi:hypothetical protein
MPSRSRDVSPSGRIDGLATEAAFHGALALAFAAR